MNCIFIIYLPTVQVRSDPTRSFEKLKPYLEESFTGMRLMRGIDAAIVATAFGQLYLEGTIGSDIKELAKLSIERELLPEVLKHGKSMQMFVK